MIAPNQPLRVEFPKKFAEALQKNPDFRYMVLKGGRGSTKSWSVARHFVVEGAFTKHRYLCTREMQNSIKDSVHRLLSDQIYGLGLQDYFNIQRDAIYSVAGSEYLFKGLRHNISEIKSTEGITRCWVEEAEKVSQESWDTLTPTIRKEGSQIFIVFNPEEEKGATYQKFIPEDKRPPGTIVVEMNYVDNPWFPDVLRREMEYDKRVDYEKYQHIWLGQVKKYAQDLIYKNVRVEDFETPGNARFHFGADFGFADDPSALIRMFIKGRDHNAKCHAGCKSTHPSLYIDYEAYGHGVELEEMEQFYDSVPEVRKWKIIADCARPDTISYLKKKGFNIVGAEKGKGSVEDGITFLRSFEAIIIHKTRCPHTAKDFGNYRYKRDKITQEILPVPAEGSDHSPDAGRYGLEPYIKSKKTIWEVL